MTESKNNIMVEFGRDLFRSSGSATLVKQMYLENTSQDPVQNIFKVTHCLSGQIAVMKMESVLWINVRK